MGIVLGEVESLEGALDLRALASSFGLTRYERRVLWARDMVIDGKTKRLVVADVAAGLRRKAMVAMEGDWSV